MAELFDTQTRGHHPDSPSSLQSSEACPLFENEQRESLASAAGTLQHKASETRDLTILDSDEQTAAVEKCLAYEDRILAMYRRIEQEKAESPVYPAYAVRVEKEQYLAVGCDIVGVYYAGWNTGAFVGVTGGFPDIVIRNGYHADILDWKFGKVPVTPTKSNVQGISYALGAFEKWPTLLEVTVHFVAPYQGWSSEEQQELYVHTFRRQDIAELELRVRTIIAQKKEAAEQVARNDWTLATPKTDLCLWCARKGSCQPNIKLIIQASKKHQAIVVPEVVDHYLLSKPEQYKQAFRWANQVIMIAESIKKRCADAVLTEDLELGDDIKIVKRTERRVTSVQGLLRTALKHGVKLKFLIEILSVPITKVEDAIKASAGKGKGAAAIRAFKADLEDSGITVPGTPVYFLQEVRSPAEKKQTTLEIEA